MWKWLLLVLALSFAAFAIQSGDVLMYLSIARDYIFKGLWLQLDQYVYSETDDILHWWHEYLSYLIFYFAWWLGGVAGLIGLKLVLLAGMFWCALRSKPDEQNSNPVWICLFVLALVAGSFRYIERSSLFSDLFMVFLACRLLESRVLTRRLLAELTILFLLWIQLHPGFVTGLIFVYAWAVWNIARGTPGFGSRQVALLLLPTLTLLLNPLFLEGVTYPFRFALNEAQTLRLYNFEWFPSYHPAFRFTPEVLSFWFLSLLSLAFWWRAKAWRDLHFVFALLAFLITLSTVRFMPWSALVIAIGVKPYARLTEISLEKRWLKATLAVLLVAVTIKNFVWGYASSSGQRLPQWTFDPKFFPTTNLELLRTQRLPGRVYNSHDFGSSLIWHTREKVFHHGFVTDMKFYREEVIGAMSTRERFLELAAKYDWTMLLVDKYGGYREFHRILSPLTEWKIVGEDEASYLIYKLPPSGN